MGPRLPAAFLDRPIAHRALHGPDRPENSLAAVQAAIDADYAIEIDIQPSAEGTAMVFHDYDMTRLTGQSGPIAMRSTSALTMTPLLGGDGNVPTLREVLDLVSGRVPLLIEIKDQDGALGPNVGPLEDTVAETLAGYTGPVALMSFNPHSVAHLARVAPQLPRGLTTCSFAADVWPVPKPRLAEVRPLPDIARTGASFISHDHTDLHSPHVARAKSEGLDILCWTIRTPEDDTAARRVAANVTFEGYLP